MKKENKKKMGPRAINLMGMFKYTNVHPRDLATHILDMFKDEKDDPKWVAMGYTHVAIVHVVGSTLVQPSHETCLIFILIFLISQLTEMVFHSKTFPSV